MYQMVYESTFLQVDYRKKIENLCYSAFFQWDGAYIREPLYSKIYGMSKILSPFE